MKQNTIENEIDFLYQQRQELVKEKEYYLKELERINEKINVLEKDYYSLPSGKEAYNLADLTIKLDDVQYM